MHPDGSCVAGAETLADDPPDEVVDEMVAASVHAQRRFECWREARVDALLTDIATSIHAHARALAVQTVAETGMGNADDKAAKISLASVHVVETLAGRTGAGTVSIDEDRGITEIASPMGVIVALVPVTNPVPTIVNKTLIALKSRNSIILSSHRMAQHVGNETGEIIRAALGRHGAPDELVQWVRGRTTRRRTVKLMSHSDVALILATGGPGMVKAAYSSGNPAIGVGGANAPAWIAPDANPTAVAKAVVASKSFDNGLTCGAEQHLVADVSVHDELVEALIASDAVVLTQEETARVIEHTLDEHGHLRAAYVGKAAPELAALAGLRPRAGAKLLVLPTLLSSSEDLLGKERLAPICSLSAVDGDDEAIALCRRVLASEGAGHTAVIHTRDEHRVARFAAAMPAGRILVNVPAALGSCGLATGLQLSCMLGCGTYGGNSTTDNVSYEHLRNIKRVAYPHVRAPSRLTTRRPAPTGSRTT